MAGPVSPEPTPSTPPAVPGPSLTPPRRRGVGPFSLRQVAGALGVVVVTAIVLTVATAPLGSTTPGLPDPAASAYLLRSPIPGLRVGDLAPELAGAASDGSAFVLADLDGNPIRLADLRGRAVWVNFWASWCPPCQSETPILREIDERYRDRGLTLVAVQVQQTVEDGVSYADRYDLEYAIGADVSAAVFRTYRVFALPTQFFIDPDGVIRAVVNGPLDLAGATRLVESILPPAGRVLPTGTTSPSASP
ncbi:MAG: TlpA family protein disulfide reductase [Chloroflexi bacterium]|nr:TlpA family protein disulfide reductase [Chloroflexota bacterium]